MKHSNQRIEHTLHRSLVSTVVNKSLLTQNYLLFTIYCLQSIVPPIISYAHNSTNKITSFERGQFKEMKFCPLWCKFEISILYKCIVLLIKQQHQWKHINLSSIHTNPFTFHTYTHTNIHKQKYFKASPSYDTWHIWQTCSNVHSSKVWLQSYLGLFISFL